jgi:hypothetical protein
MPWSETITAAFGGAIIGAVFGALGTWFIDSRRRNADNKQREQRAKSLYSLVVNEVEQGIERMETIIEKAQTANQEGSGYSAARIYTIFWSSFVRELGLHIEGTKELDLLHNCYRRFDLVNFNMDRFCSGDRTALVNAAGFAQHYHEQIARNLAELKKSTMYRHST